VQLEVQTRDAIARYYAGWATCDDTTCELRTRMMGVYGRRCLRAGCRGTVAFEVRRARHRDEAAADDRTVFRRDAVQPAPIFLEPVRH
jgi:hypothetical protein